MESPSFHYYDELEQGSEKWHEVRAACCVTTSEFGAAMGLDRYKSRADLVAQKLAAGAERAPPNLFMQLGTHYEPQIASAYDSALGVETETYGMVVADYGDGFVLGCSPDRVVRTEQDGRYLVEIKYSASSNVRDVPDRHLCQLLGQQMLFNVPFVDYVKWGPAELTTDGKMLLSVRRLTFDPKVWTDYALPALRDFHRCVTRKLNCNPPTTHVKQLRKALHTHCKELEVEL